jgi:hypothetical protein
MKYRINEIAESRMFMSESKVRALIKQGKLGHFRSNGSIFVTDEDIEAYWKSCRVEPAQKASQSPVRLKHLTL